jgi:hypothetical protein
MGARLSTLRDTEHPCHAISELFHESISYDTYCMML